MSNTKFALTGNRRHGSPFDRGGADSYYNRPRCPHYFIGETYSSDKVVEKDMTENQIAEYNAGYDENEDSFNKKDWG